MSRSFLVVSILVLSLSACVTTYGTFLVSEDRDGLITFYRQPLIARMNSDSHAEIYCAERQQPFTWLQTKMSKGGGFHDSYKCGAVPPSKMSVEQKPVPTEKTNTYVEKPVQREEEKQPRSISGDYFSSKRPPSQDNNW